MTNKPHSIFQIKLHIPTDSSGTCARADVQFIYSDTKTRAHTHTCNRHILQCLLIVLYVAGTIYTRVA